jgi:osmotically-inducible protein OsmY
VQESARRLSQSGYLALQSVACQARDGAIVLLGTLPSHYLKQLAQAIASSVEPGLEVINQIEVGSGVQGH